ncbi:MAG: BON domain-containing protein [Gammaproteobacteria bacterium]
MSKRTLILASLLAVMWLPMGCVIVVDGNGDMDAGWANSWEAEREEQVEANKALARDVSKRLANDPLLDGVDIEVAAKGDAVALHGRVPDTATLDHALKVAAETPGVATVVSRLSVEVKTP